MSYKINNLIYKDPNLKIKFTNEELEKINEGWEFLNNFNKPYLSFIDYRRNLIKNISEKYTPEDFLFFETIIEKFFWNLRWKLAPYFLKKDINLSIDEFPNDLLICKQIPYENEFDLKTKIRTIKLTSGNYYRSFINKVIMVSKINKIIWVKDMEGSPHIFTKNYFNHLTMILLFDRNKYEKIMEDPQNALKKIKLSKYYHQQDYGFSNLNFCSYKIFDTNEKLDRIKKMYYTEDPKIDKKCKYWFKLIL